MDVAVIGSGVSGFAAADALARRGLRPVIIDVGESLDAERVAVVDRLRETDMARLSSDERLLIGENPTLREGEIGRAHV